MGIKGNNNILIAADKKEYSVVKRVPSKKVFNNIMNQDGIYDKDTLKTLYQNILDGESYCYTLENINGNIIGLSVINDIKGDTCRLEYIVLDKTTRGHGNGKRLLDSILSDFESTGQRIWFRVNDDPRFWKDKSVIIPFVPSWDKKPWYVYIIDKEKIEYNNIYLDQDSGCFKNVQESSVFSDMDTEKTQEYIRNLLKKDLGDIVKEYVIYPK